MNKVTPLRTLRQQLVCPPASARTSQDVLAVEIVDDLLSPIGGEPGNLAIIALREKPINGGAGAVRAGGSIYLGFLFFPLGGGCLVSDAVGSFTGTFLFEGSFEVLGKVDRICKSCATGNCFLVHVRKTEISLLTDTVK